MTPPPVFPERQNAELPAAWRERLDAALLPGEAVAAWLDLDLDGQLHYVPSLLVLADSGTHDTQASPPISHRQRLLWLAGDGTVHGWPLDASHTLQQQDHAGIGTLSLGDGQRRLAQWRYTMSRQPAAATLIQAHEQHDEKPAAAHPGPAPAASGSRRARRRPWALLRLWRFARPYRWPLLGGLLLTLAATAAGLVAPYLTMPLMDEVLIPYQNGEDLDQEKVRYYLGALLGSALVAWVLGWGRTYLLARISERIGTDLRTTTYEHLQTLSLQYFGGKRTGDLISRLSSETDRLCLFLSLHLLDFITDVLVIVMTAVILFSIHPLLAAATLVPLPLIVWLIQLVRGRLRRGFEKIDRSWAEITNVLADTIPGIRVVKAFAQEKREVQRFRAANLRYLAVNDRVNALWALFSPTITFLTEVGLLVVWVFGIWLVVQDNITVGVLAAFLTYIGRFYVRLDDLSRIVSTTQQAATGAKRIFDVLDQVSTVPEPTHPVSLPRVQGRLQLRGVGFRHGNRHILRNINLDIEPGQMIGLVGHSGAGKSTLINLICRFYDASAGTLSIDGVDIRRLPVAEYRRHIGLVLQEPFLFFGTVAENIAYGKPEASRQEIVAAARAAQAHDFILRLPHGYDSLVGERGQALSGGERQRLSIARALLIDPPILILDEATASVDTATEQEIQTALDNLVRGRTTLSIAHRLSTLRQADRLIVMDRGEIVETGTHDSLMASGGIYQQLHEAQARANAEGAAATQEEDEEEDEHAEAIGDVDMPDLDDAAHAAGPIKTDDARPPAGVGSDAIPRRETSPVSAEDAADSAGRRPILQEERSPR